MSTAWMSRVWREMRRRKVSRIALAYAVVGWGAVQVADTAFPHLSIPAWGVTLVIALVTLGFPVALVLAWAYDVTPDGIKRTDTPPRAPERPDWREVQRVLTAALELPPADRPNFVERACAGEMDMHREVESLLAAHARSSLLDRPALELAMPQRQPAPAAPPSPGRRVANYQILEKLAGGGMGVVYKARDLRLERIVALKFLPPHLGADERAKERFMVEAQSAAALDHPNICTIHEIGEAEDGHLFLTMPFYDGNTLKQRIAEGALPAQEAADIALQVGRGLAKAHERGIIHRDIKPANLVITAEGVVKIVDFGVAKLADVSITHPGVTPGTPAYMSPEQARGEEVDGRTDVWSLGVVLYEMLTRERPFRGSHASVLLQSIIATDPQPIVSLRTGVPLALERVVMRALAKLPEERYGTAGEMVEALEEARSLSTRGPASVGHERGTERRASGAGFDNSAAAESGGSLVTGVLPEAERRWATIVTATLSGFDAMMDSLHPAELEEVTAQLRREAAEVAMQHGGSLNQLTGEEMVFLFGIPTAHEDDGVRAVRAALEMRERVRTLSGQVETRGGGTLRTHAGIDTGRVVAHDGGGSGERALHVVGGPMQISGRLAVQAGPDEVWVSAECHHHVAPFFETVAGEPLAVRDRKQPLTPYLIIGESGLQTRLEAAEKAGLTAYAGREEEIATLSRCLASTMQGEGQVVTVVGEAGMGKSRLLYEFRQRHRHEQPNFLIGRCQSYGSAVAYLPFIEILRTGIGLGEAGAGASPERAVQRILEISPELEEFIPLYLQLLSIPSARHPVPKHLQGDALRLATQDALVEILTATAQLHPMVVLLEDWHWADEASNTVRKGISEVVSGVPMLVIVTTRPGYAVDPGTLGQEISIPLRPLQPSFSAEILRSRLGVERFPGELEGLLHERTGGNPFFLEEICQTLVEEGSLRIEGAEARLAGPVQMLDLPDSVQAVIRARLDRLDRCARDVLRLASVAGREFTRGILDRALSDGDSLPAALETLKTTGLIQQMRGGREPVYRFKHVLTQEVAYDSLLEHQRRDLHGRVGLVIEQLHAEHIEEHLDRLAHHFSRAESWAKAVRYGLLSAARTSELAQFSDALQILERTQRWLAKLPQGPERKEAQVDILLRQERVCETLGLRTRQQQIIDELVSILDPSRDPNELAEALLRQGDLFILLRQFGEAEAALERSLRIRRELGDSVGERNTLRSFGLLRWHEGRNEEALEFVHQTLRIDRQRQDVVGIVGDLTNLGVILRSLGEDDRAEAALEEAIAEGAAGGQTAGLEDELSTKRIYALQILSVLHRKRGDLARAFEYVEQAGRVAKEKRLPIQLSYYYTSVAHFRLQQGEVEESLRAYQESIDLTRKAKFAPGLAYSLRLRGEVLIGLDRYDESLRDLEEAASVFAQLRDTAIEAQVWSKIATARERAQDHAGAMRAWARAVELHRERRDAAGELEAVEGLGGSARRCQADLSLTLAHFHRALELALALGDTPAEGRLRNTIGILHWERGEYELALEQYERAFTMFQGLHDSVHAGLMLNSIGVTLKALRRWGEARVRLEEAVALNHRAGERQLEGHALAALGDISMELGEAERAREYYQQSLDIRREIGDDRGAGWMLHGLARSDRFTGRAETARALLDQAGRIAEECGDPELASACERLTQLPTHSPYQEELSDAKVHH